MNTYKIMVYGKGFPMTHVKVEETTPLKAAKKVAKPYGWSHVIVLGKNVNRYGKGYKKLQNFTLTKLWYEGKLPAIFAMFDNITEIYVFEKETQRDERFEEVSKCTEFPFVESAKADPEQTDTTVYFDGTSGSESSSTSKRTSSGCATSVTWPGLLTQKLIAKSSGTPKSVAMDTTEWYSGSKASHSKQDQTLFATVILKEHHKEFPGTNKYMLMLKGKTITVKRSKFSGNEYGRMYSGGGYTWQKEWLDFNHVNLKVKRGDKPNVTSPNGVYVTYMPSIHDHMKGMMLKCNCGCGFYNHQGAYLAPQWLEPYDPDAPRLEPLTDKEKKIASLPFASMDNEAKRLMMRAMAKSVRQLKKSLIKDTSKWMEDMRHE